MHHFKLQLCLDASELKEREGLQRLEAYPHDHLKVVEIVRFPVDLEIAVSLIESAVSLDKISLDTRCVFLIDYVFELEENPEKIRAREQSIQLRANLKPGTKLEILCWSGYIRNLFLSMAMPISFGTSRMN